MNNKLTLKEIFLEAHKEYKEKNFKIAENLCYKIISIDREHFDSLSLLATIFAVNNNFNKAREFLKKANEIQPKNITILNNLGTACKELGELEESINYYNKALKIDSNHINATYNLGLVFYKLKELIKAKAYFQKTVQIQSNYAMAFFSLGNVHADLKEFENAISSYQKSIEINPNILGAHNNLGLVFRILNDFENAISCYKRVLKIKPNHVGVLHNLAMAYKEIGDFKNAIKSHEASIKFEPENPTHYYYLSDIKKNVLDSKLKNKLEKILKNKKSTVNNIAFGNFLLARYERKAKNYEKEFKYLIEGHKNFFNSKKEKFELGIKYCFDDVLQISKGVNVSNQDTKDEQNIKPIFIVGVPRCGSTLVEKIIGSGERLIPMGEETSVLENYFNKKILEKHSLNIGEAKIIRNEINDIYKQKGLMSKKFGFTFTDKSLNNFFYLDLIKSVYPNAKIINCKRNVLASIISILQNNLTELAWAHDVKNIFKYFNNYFEIIDNFNNIYPNLIYELDFEKFTKDPENESKKLIKFCDLPWNKKCLEFYKRKDLISKTASNVQIRETIYKQTMERYAPYKKYLDKFGEKYLWFNQ